MTHIVPSGDAEVTHPAAEPVISPEMVTAGLEELSDYERTAFFDSPEQAVRKIFRAMSAAAQMDGSQRHGLPGQAKPY